MTKDLKISSNEKLTLISNMGTMLSSGIPILEVVDSMLEGTRGNQKKILETLREDLTQGKTIHSSFGRFPKTFDPITVNIVKVAEEAGTLDTTLKDLTENIKKEIEFIDKIKAALIYPTLVIVIFTIVLLIILTFVIPRVATVFDRLKITLPLPTKILIVTSNVFLTYTPLIIVVIVSLAIGIFFLYKAQKEALLNIVFVLPVLSRLSREIDLARFTRSMSLLLSSGIPITEALELSENVVNKKEVKGVITTSRSLVSSGKKLTDGFKKSKGAMPPIMIRIIEAGEKSGTLEKSMQDLATYFDLQVSNTLKTLTTLFEPILLVIIGFFVGGVMLAIVAPIYRLIGQIGAR